MTRTMYDSVTPAGIPSTATMVAGYVDGRYRNITAMQSRFPYAVVVGIATSPLSDDGIVIDVEKGDASPQGAARWVEMRRSHGYDPTVYVNSSQWQIVKDAFSLHGIRQPHFWVAHWDGHTAIPAGAVAKQFGSFPGYDISSVVDYWPGMDKPKPTPPAQAYYVVRKNDTMSSIAAKYGISLPQLEKLNQQIKNPNLIVPGEHVFVSGHPTVKATYVVKADDTLSGIAEAHGLTLAQILAKNPRYVGHQDLIYPGDKVYV